MDKTTFLRQKLISALETRGALVIYVDLLADRTKSPSALVQEAVRNTLRQLQTPGSGLLPRFEGFNLGAAGFGFGFQLDNVGQTGGATLAQAFEDLVHKAEINVVLIVDEVQQTLGTEEGFVLLHALKGARGADALAAYAERICSAADTSQVQNTVDKMVSANLILRPTHGKYTVADPFVRKVWRDKLALLTLLAPLGTLPEPS